MCNVPNLAKNAFLAKRNAILASFIYCFNIAIDYNC